MLTGVARNNIGPGSALFVEPIFLGLARREGAQGYAQG
jgi:hypothetical protein